MTTLMFILLVFTQVKIRDHFNGYMLDDVQIRISFGHPQKVNLNVNNTPLPCLTLPPLPLSSSTLLSRSPLTPDRRQHHGW